MEALSAYNNTVDLVLQEPNQTAVVQLQVPGPQVKVHGTQMQVPGPQVHVPVSGLHAQSLSQGAALPHAEHTRHLDLHLAAISRIQQR